MDLIIDYTTLSFSVSWDLVIAVSKKKRMDYGVEKVSPSDTQGIDWLLRNLKLVDESGSTSKIRLQVTIPWEIYSSCVSLMKEFQFPLRYTILSFPLLSQRSGQPVARYFPAFSMVGLSHMANHGSISEISVFNKKTRNQILFDPHQMAFAFVDFNKILLNSRLSNCLRYSGKKNGRSRVYFIVYTKMKLD